MSNNTELEIANKRLLLVELERRVSAERSKLDSLLQGYGETTLKVAALEKRQSELEVSNSFLEKAIANASDSLSRLQEQRASMSQIPSLT